MQMTVLPRPSVYWDRGVAEVVGGGGAGEGDGSIPGEEESMALHHIVISPSSPLNPGILSAVRAFEDDAIPGADLGSECFLVDVGDDAVGFKGDDAQFSDRLVLGVGDEEGAVRRGFPGWNRR